MDEALYIELIQHQFPQIDFSCYKISKVTQKENEGKSSDIYKKRLFVTMEETSDPPDQSWDWYAHWFTDTKYEDRPMRAKAVTLIIRRKRRKNRVTNKTKMSDIEGIQMYPKTEKPEDLLDFLKYTNWVR